MKGSYLEYRNNSRISVRKMTDNPKDLKNYFAEGEIYSNQDYAK